jgi:hypothetical protein
MTTNSQERIYLNPPKFWAATKDMTDEAVEQLTNRLLRLAAERRIGELQRYDFISFGHKRAA